MINNDLKPINFDVLHEIIGNDMDSVIECFEDFLSAFPAKIKDLKKKIRSKNIVKISNSIHSFKNLLTYIAATKAIRLIKTLEEICKEGDMKDIKKVVIDLENETKKIKYYLMEFISKNKEEIE